MEASVTTNNWCWSCWWYQKSSSCVLALTNAKVFSILYLLIMICDDLVTFKPKSRNLNRRVSRNREHNWGARNRRNNIEPKYSLIKVDKFKRILKSTKFERFANLELGQWIVVSYRSINIIQSAWCRQRTWNRRARTRPGHRKHRILHLDLHSGRLHHLRPDLHVPQQPHKPRDPEDLLRDQEDLLPMLFWLGEDG